MSEQDEVGAGVLAAFSRFQGGISAATPEMRDVTHDLGTQELTVQVPTFDGRTPGEVASIDFWVRQEQLQLGPREDLVCSLYNPAEDPDFDRYTATLDQLGEEAPSLTVLPANRTVRIAGNDEPMFVVYDRPEVYFGLIKLGRARVRVHLSPAKNPGSILLQAVASHGQLRREPSIMETCLASKRLKDEYGFTLQEIAQARARDPEDHTPPSVTQVHYEILVAGLPKSVRDRVHQGHILWSHARMIAEHCGEDGVLAEGLAAWVVQGGRMTVDKLRITINRLRDGLCRLEMGSDGSIQLIPIGSQLSSVSTRPAPDAKATVFYQRMMAAPASQVRRYATGFNVMLLPADTPDKIAVPVAAVDELRTRLSERRGPTSVRDLEAMLLGYLEALRTAGMRQGLITQEGELAAVVDAAVDQVAASS